MRKSKEDWLEAGLQTLGEAGVNGLTIERLTEELDITKGSFYHHFNNVEDFRQKMIAFWADQYLSTSSNIPNEASDLLALLDTIVEEAFGAVTEPEMTIRVWAQQDGMVRSFVQQVDAVRVEFVFKVFQAVIGDNSKARLMTDMLSAMLVGSMMVLPRISPERVTELYQEFKRLYRI